MTTDDERRVRDIFLEACDLPRDARRSVLDERCAGNSAIRRAVERLLDADTKRDHSDAPLGPGAEIGASRLVRLIGEGRSGAVYEATLGDDRRRVAVKIMCGAAPSETRRDALLRLEHTGVLRIHEVGAERGVTFVAMDLVVDALSLTTFADISGLTRTNRIELAIQLCGAVEHLHEQGVCHGDLKPTNVLCDARGRPKLIDFAATLEGDALAADYRALGTTVFELVQGRLPRPEERTSFGFQSPDLLAADLRQRLRGPWWRRLGRRER